MNSYDVLLVLVCEIIFGSVVSFTPKKSVVYHTGQVKNCYSDVNFSDPLFSIFKLFALNLPDSVLETMTSHVQWGCQYFEWAIFVRFLNGLDFEWFI